MREDMPKVIVERPRHGHSMRGPGKGYRRKWQRIPLEEQPRRERLRQGNGTKSFSERLGPLVKFLQSRVGRAWDEVHAEICAHLSRDNVIQDHVRDHLGEMVVTHVYLEKGKPFHAHGYAFGTPVRARGAWFWRFYVCPRSGALKDSPRTTKRGWKASRKNAGSSPVLVPHGFDEYWLCRQGVWYLATFRRFPKEQYLDPAYPPLYNDLAMKCEISRAEARAFYGRAMYVSELRPASREEVRRYCK